MSLGMEYVEIVCPALRETELARLRIKIDGASDSLVEASQVERQFAVDENPDIVIATKRKRLATGVQKRSVNLCREMEVVGTALVAESKPIEWEKAAAVKNPAAACLLSKRNGLLKTQVDGVVSVPLIKRLFAAGLARRTHGRVNRKALRIELHFHQAWKDAGAHKGFKVRVRVLKITHASDEPMKTLSTVGSAAGSTTGQCASSPLSRSAARASRGGISPSSAPIEGVGCLTFAAENRRRQQETEK